MHPDLHHIRKEKYTQILEVKQLDYSQLAKTSALSRPWLGKHI